MVAVEMTDRHAESMAALVTELLDEVVIRPAWVTYTRTRSGTGKKAATRQVTRRDPGLLWQLGSITGRTDVWWAREDTLAIEGKRIVRTGHRLVRRTGQADRVMLGAAVPSGSPGWDADGALGPSRGGAHGSRTPATSALELADEIASGVHSLYGLLTNAAALPKSRRTVEGRLRALVSLVGLVERHLADWAVYEAQSWVTACRTHLNYDAALIELRDWYCPECHGRLRSRVDDESLVWCAGIGVVQGPRECEDDPMPVRYGGCGAKWPKGQWVDLLVKQKVRRDRERSTP